MADEPRVTVHGQNRRTAGQYGCQIRVTDGYRGKNGSYRFAIAAGRKYRVLLRIGANACAGLRYAQRGGKMAKSLGKTLKTVIFGTQLSIRWLGVRVPSASLDKSLNPWRIEAFFVDGKLAVVVRSGTNKEIPDPLWPGSCQVEVHAGGVAASTGYLVASRC